MHTDHPVATRGAEALAAADLPLGIALPFVLTDAAGVTLLPASAALPDAAARDFLLTHFSPLRSRADAAAGTQAARGNTTAAEAPSIDGADPPEPLRINTGELLYLRPFPGSGYRIASARAIGVAPNGAIFIAAPMSQGQPMPLIVGERVDMLYVAHRTLFHFACTVEAQCKVPFAYAILSAPGAVRRLRTRDAQRVHMHLPVLVGRAGAQAFDGVAVMRDLSRIGLSLAATGPLGKPGETLRVAFHLDGHGVALDVDALVQVRHTRTAIVRHGESLVEHGFAFEELTPAQALALQCFILAKAQP
jgi:hypothetical protein